MYVLVAATPISGPALVYITWCASLVMLLPTTFTIASVSDTFLAVLSACSVSAVSPDCVMNITSVWSSSVSWKYSNSLASITSVGMCSCVSMRYSPIIDAW